MNLGSCSYLLININGASLHGPLLSVEDDPPPVQEIEHYADGQEQQDPDEHPEPPQVPPLFHILIHLYRVLAVVCPLDQVHPDCLRVVLLRAVGPEGGFVDQAGVALPDAVPAAVDHEGTPVAVDFLLGRRHLHYVGHVDLHVGLGWGRSLGVLDGEHRLAQPALARLVDEQVLGLPVRGGDVVHCLQRVGLAQ